jgi:hypothetical protein
MLNIIYALMGKLFGWDKQTDEYWRRFIEPQIARARALGFPDDTIGRMLQAALIRADFEYIYPGTILRDLIDDLAFLFEKPGGV